METKQQLNNNFYIKYGRTRNIYSGRITNKEPSPTGSSFDPDLF